MQLDYFLPLRRAQPSRATPAPTAKANVAAWSTEGDQFFSNQTSTNLKEKVCMYIWTEMLEVRFLRQKRKTVLRRQKLFLYFPFLFLVFFEDEVLVALTLKTKKFHVLM